MFCEPGLGIKYGLGLGCEQIGLFYHISACLRIPYDFDIEFLKKERETK